MSSSDAPDSTWHDLWEHFHRLVELDRQDRENELAVLRAGDPQLGERLAELLEADERVDDALSDLDDELGAESAPRRVGAWQLGELLGAGGMGSVYRARRVEGDFQQTAAVKLLQAAATTSFRARFEAERQLLAELDHPHIARLLDGGTTERGVPYLVLELVEGRAINEHCEAEGLDLRARVRLFLDVCSAVQTAHERLVVHRDLKPANILVTSGGSDQSGRVKLLDFGIAKLLDDGAERTATLHQLLTPRYASPEQIEGEPLTTATDVFSLGTLLFELLTGRHPTAASGESPLTVARGVVERDAPPASHAARRCADAPTGAARALRGDLDAVIGRALSKNPAKRYSSAAALADDLRAWLDGRPVRAQPDSALYRLRRLAARNPVVTALGTAVLFALVGWTVTLRSQTVQLREALRLADQERERAQNERDTANATREFLTSVFAVTDPNRAGGQLTAREILERGAQRTATELEGDPEVRAAVQFSIGTVYRNLGLFDEGAALLEQALATRRKILPSPHPATAETLDHLGMLRLYQNRHDEAIALLEEALAMRRAIYTPEDPELAVSVYSLGSALSQIGRLDQARPVLEEALELQRDLEIEDPDLLGTGSTHEQLAVLAHRQGDYDTAIFHYRAALDATGARDADKPRYTTALANLGGLLLDRGELAEARDVLEQALRVYEHYLGADHHRVASVLNNFALLEQREGNLEAAQQLFERALAINQESFDEPHSAIATNLNNLGLVQLEQQQHDRASPLFERAATMQRALYGKEHPSTAFPLSNLGRLEFERGRNDRAEQLQREAMALRVAALPSDHTALATSQAWLGLLLAETSRADEGRPLLERAIAIREAKLAPDDWRLAEARAFLGICLLREGQPQEALRLLEPALGAVRKSRGPESARTQRLAAAVREAKATVSEGAP